jgi:hypothetical protein
MWRMLQNILKCEVNELPKFNAVGKEAYQMLEKQCLCFKTHSLV